MKRKHLNKGLKIGVVALLLLLMSGGVLASGNNQNSLEKVDFNKSTLEISEILDNFETVTANPVVFKNSADNGSVKIGLLEKELDIELHQVPVQSNDAEIIIDNNSGSYAIKAPKVYTYKGKVIGVSNSSALFTVSDDVLIGKIEVAGTSYIIEQTNKKDNGRVVHVVYTSDAIKKRNISVYNTDGVVRQAPLGTLPSFEAPISSGTLTTTTVDLLASYDTEFQNTFSNPTAEISNMINSVNNAYSPTGVTLNIKSYKYYSNIQNSDACTVRSNFASTASGDRDSTRSDLAFLFSGKEFTTDDIGCAWQYNGWSGGAYAVAQMVSAGIFTSYGGSYDDRTIVTAHEIGHLFGADHQNSNQAYAKAYSWDAGWLRTDYTALWTPYMGIFYPYYMQLEFSNANNHGDSTHDNARRISETKATVAGFR